MKISAATLVAAFLVVSTPDTTGQGLGDSIGATCTAVEGSLTCDACPACISASCAQDPVPLPPKSPFWPPLDILQRPYGPDPIPADFAAELEWFQTTVLDVLPKQVKQSETKYALTVDEERLILMTLPEWQKARKGGKYSCSEMAMALTKRAMYLQDIQSMNHFMYWKDFQDETAVEKLSGVFDWVAVVRKQASDLDAKANTEGVESIAPLYCYPVPLKGTMVTKDFPSSSGFAVLQDYFGIIDADLVTLIREANGVLFGKTNVPELAHSYGTGNYANGLAFNPWDYNMMTGGSSGGSGAAVASYTATIAVTEDTGGSTNTPAARNHLFGYDPPKFHFPNGGNPSLTYRNDQLGLNARTIDDIIAFDEAVLGTSEAHAAAKAYVDGLKNSDIRIGCSTVYYNYTTATTAIKEHYAKVEQVLKDAGFTFITECQDKNPMDAVPTPEGFSHSAVWFEELESFMINGLGLTDIDPWEVLLNGVYDFGTSLSMGWLFGSKEGEGCDLINKNSDDAKQQFLGPIPAARSDVYNEYFDANQVDLLMGPSQYCDHVLWTEDIGGSIGANAGCDGGRAKSSCMSNCHSEGIKGSRDKMFTKAKFVVPVNKTSIGEPYTVQFMSRAGPRNPTIPASEWVYDLEGPKTWNLEELYMVKRISDTLAQAGLGRADAPFNEEVTGLRLDIEDEGSSGVASIFNTFSMVLAVAVTVAAYVEM